MMKLDVQLKYYERKKQELFIFFWKYRISHLDIDDIKFSKKYNWQHWSMRSRRCIITEFGMNNRVRIDQMCGLL